MLRPSGSNATHCRAAVGHRRRLGGADLVARKRHDRRRGDEDDDECARPCDCAPSQDSMHVKLLRLVGLNADHLDAHLVMIRLAGGRRPEGSREYSAPYGDRLDRDQTALGRLDRDVTVWGVPIKMEAGRGPTVKVLVEKFARVKLTASSDRADSVVSRTFQSRRGDSNPGPLHYE